MPTQLFTARALSAAVLTGTLLTACAPQVQEVIVTAPPIVVTSVVRSTAAPALPTLVRGDTTGFTSVDAPASSVRMVIKDAELELLIADTDIALAKITQMAADYGGYLLSSQVNEVNNLKQGTVRLSVPSVQFEAALNSLRMLSIKVLRESASGQDVSAEYVDLKSRLGNLEATAARVREFLAQAQTVEESLKVSQQLSELEGQIEQVKGQMQYYEGRAAFSTITITLTSERLQITPTPTPEWNPNKTFTQASGALTKLAQGLADALIWLTVIVGPFVLILATLVGLVWAFIRAVRPRQPRKG